MSDLTTTLWILRLRASGVYELWQQGSTVSEADWLETFDDALDGLTRQTNLILTSGSGASTSLTAQAASGQKVLTVASSTGFVVGDTIFLGLGTLAEPHVIASIGGATSITTTVNLTNTHAIGQPVSRSPVEIVDARGTAATLADRLDQVSPFNVKTYGAIGDGVTDDSAEIQAAIDAANAIGGGTIVIPAGTYQVTTALTIPGNNINIVGAGMGATILRRSGAGAMIVNSNTAVLRERFRLSDLTFNGQGGATASGVKLENFKHAIIERARFENFGGIGVEFYGTGSTYYNRVSHCWFNSSIAGCTGVKWTNGAANPNACDVEFCVFSGAANTTGANMAGGTTNGIYGSHFESVLPATLLTITTAYNKVIGCRFETGTVLLDTGANWNRFTGNTYANDVTRTETNGSQNTRVADHDGGPFQAPSVVLRRGAVQSIPNNTDTAIIWDDETLDAVEPMHDATTTPERATARVDGRYRVTYTCVMAANATGSRIARVKVNGVTYREATGTPHATIKTRIIISTIVSLVRGDYVEGFILQDSGGALDADDLADGCELTMDYVSA